MPVTGKRERAMRPRAPHIRCLLPAAVYPTKRMHRKAPLSNRSPALQTGILVRAPSCIREDTIQSIRGADTDVEYRLIKIDNSVITAIPRRNVRLRDFGRQSLGAVPSERLVEGKLIVVAASDVNVIVSQLREHLAIALGMQYAFDHHIKPVIQSEPCRQVDVGNAQRTGMITNMKDFSPQHVMTDNRHTPRSRTSDSVRQLRFPTTGIPADDDQSGALRTSHPPTVYGRPSASVSAFRLAPLAQRPTELTR